MQIKSEDALLNVNGEPVEDWAEKKVAIHGGRGLSKQASPIPVQTFGDRITKKQMLDALKKALMASGHTKARATVLAKEHYKKYLGCQR